MLYLLALIAPPLAVLMAGRFWHAVLNFLMCCTILLIPVAMVHAWLMVQASYTHPTGAVVVNTHQYNQTESFGGGRERKPKAAPRRTRRTTDYKDW